MSHSRRRRLGQHMLVDRRVLSAIVAAAQISPSETVCEVGTGLGILTEELCKRAKKVISFELDERLARATMERLQFGNLEIIVKDAFRQKELEFDVFVSNLPYSRSRDAIEWLAARRFGRAVVMLQREFGDKLEAGPGSSGYRAVSALAQHCFEISRVASVDRRSFSPRPAVGSVVLKLAPVNTVENQTIKALNLLFSKRNRMASSVLAKAGIADAGFGDRRIDELLPGELVKVAEMLHDIRSF